MAPFPKLRILGLRSPEQPGTVIRVATLSRVDRLPATEQQAKGRAGIRGHVMRHFRSAARSRAWCRRSLPPVRFLLKETRRHRFLGMYRVEREWLKKCK